VRAHRARFCTAPGNPKAELVALFDRIVTHIDVELRAELPAPAVKLELTPPHRVQWDWHRYRAQSHLDDLIARERSDARADEPRHELQPRRRRSGGAAPRNSPWSRLP